MNNLTILFQEFNLTGYWKNGAGGYTENIILSIFCWFRLQEPMCRLICIQRLNVDALFLQRVEPLSDVQLLGGVELLGGLEHLGGLELLGGVELLPGVCYTLLLQEIIETTHGKGSTGRERAWTASGREQLMM